MQKIIILDYGSGNLHSIAKAFEAVSSGGSVLVTSDASKLNDASHIVLPGVGAYGDCINALKAMPGALDILNENVIAKQKPFFGICVGMQLLSQEGCENGRHQGLGWIEGSVVAIDSGNNNLKIPHMGWNDIKIESDSEILNGVVDGSDLYFVHSYHFKCKNRQNIIATTQYGHNITAFVQKENIIGSQFHPEKSQKNGLKIISNFLKM